MNTNEILKWSATVLITISALQVSLVVEWSTQWWAFIGFLVGHVIWSIFTFIMREWPLFALNFTFIFIDLYAIILRLLDINT